VPRPRYTSKPRGKKWQFSLDVSIGKEILARSIGHLERNNLPRWDKFEQQLCTKTQSDVPQVTDILQYRLKEYAVTITATVAKEIVGPITIRGTINWDTIVEEVQRMVTASKAIKDISFEVLAEYLDLSPAVSTLGKKPVVYGTQEILAQLATTKRKVFWSTLVLNQTNLSCTELL